MVMKGPWWPSQKGQASTVTVNGTYIQKARRGHRLQATPFWCSDLISRHPQLTVHTPSRLLKASRHLLTLFHPPGTPFLPFCLNQLQFSSLFVSRPSATTSKVPSISSLSPPDTAGGRLLPNTEGCLSSRNNE